MFVQVHKIRAGLARGVGLILIIWGVILLFFALNVTNKVINETDLKFKIRFIFNNRQYVDSELPQLWFTFRMSSNNSNPWVDIVNTACVILLFSIFFIIKNY